MPVIPFKEVVGKTGAVDPLQIEATAAKLGIVVNTVKLRQLAGATFPQRSVTELEILVRQS